MPPNCERGTIEEAGECVPCPSSCDCLRSTDCGGCTDKLCENCVADFDECDETCDGQGTCTKDCVANAIWDETSDTCQCDTPDF
jgi:hypothetical protein